MVEYLSLILSEGCIEMDPIMLAPILMQPNQGAQFHLEKDASEYSTGTILSQLWEDDKWHLIGFTSKSLLPAERNYKIHNKELLLVMQCLEEWRHILKGTMHMIEILNDCWNLTYFQTSPNLN